MILNGVFKSQKNACKCSNSKKNFKHVAPAGCSEDVRAVATLPDNWVPKHSGPTLANYLKQRERNHEKVLEDIIEGANVVNEEIDSKIRTLAENLLAHIKVNDQDVNSIVKQCDTGKNSLKKDIRNNALNQINKLIVQRVDDMAAFKREALSLERLRAEGLRGLLRKEFQRLIGIGHKTPEDLLHDIDQQIYEINQQLLNNSRAYLDLEGQLRVQVNDSMVRARISLTRLCLAKENASRGRSAIRWAKEEKFAQQRSASADRLISEADDSIERILDDIEGVDIAVAHVLQAYRSAVYNVFTGFSTKLTDLEKDLHYHDILAASELLCTSHTCEIAELQAVVDRTLRRLSCSKNSIPKNLLELTGADQVVMQKSLCSLGESLQDTYNILHDAGHLWDAHIVRTALAQKLTIAAVEDMLTSNDTAELSYEVQFNIALEVIKGLSDPDKVTHQFHSLVAMLDNTAQLYMQHSQAELGRLEDFMNLPAAMAKTLLSEFEVFLQKYPHSTLLSKNSGTSLPYGQSSRLSFTSSNLPLPRAILQTELQEVALKNWRNGFLECFERNVSLVPEELRHQAQLWVEERAATLQMRYSLKMVSHSIRIERVKAACDARIAELQFHDDRLESHLNAIYDLAKNLPVQSSEFGDLNSPYLYPLGMWLNRIDNDVNALLAQDSIDTAVKCLKMKSYTCRLARHNKLFEESLDVAIANYKRQIEYRVQEARISNVRFISQIQMFSEGGRYSALEATRASAALMRGSEALEISLTRAVDNLFRRRNQLLALVEHEMIPLQRLIGDVVKHEKGPDKKISKKK